ncbi:LacI family DNA-binding transcriptional regulator [Pseudomonadales bacterium]|jgi:LacI family transcriptional regulator|nr:LacI family DNA-binding transcriptional regulator [Pseudomonadales bacterium]
MNILNNKKPTITDVAKKAGVSIKTVSRVVNKEANVSDGTREKVQTAIDLLNYQPNFSARQLAGNRSFSIGLLYENPHEFNYMKGVLDGVFEACTKHGYSLLLRPCNFPVAALLHDVTQFLQQTQVDGVILTAPLGDVPELLDLLQRNNTPFAQISPNDESPRSTWVSSNDLGASEMLTDYIVSLGHRRIGFIKGPPNHSATNFRYQGYRNCLKQHGIAFEKTLVKSGSFDFESGQKAARKLLSLPTPPTAIIASNDDMASGVIQVAHELGMALPGQLSVAGFDDTPLASRLWPQLTTVKQPISEMATAVTGLLMNDIRDKSPNTQHRRFEFELVVRDSTLPPEASIKD